MTGLKKIFMRTHKLFICLVLAGFVALISAPLRAEEAAAKPREKSYKEITPPELKAKLDEVAAQRAEPFPLIDSRSPHRYTAGHLHGAKSIPWKEMKPEDLPKDKGALIIFYCDGPG